MVTKELDVFVSQDSIVEKTMPVFVCAVRMALMADNGNGQKSV